MLEFDPGKALLSNTSAETDSGSQDGTMPLTTIVYIALGFASFPFIYYLIALYSSWRFFREARRAVGASSFTPPVSLLKPVKGLDPEAYENFASFCRQDYPLYEILFCVDPDDEAVPLLNQLKREFPGQTIRLLLGSGRDAVNDKVARLVRLTNEAKYDLFVISDGDVRVEPDYLRSVVAPFSDPNVGAATCLYTSTETETTLQKLQSIAMISDFFAGIIVAWKLDGVKFTLGQTIVTTRQNIAGFGGYQTLEDRPADDLYIGRLAADQGLDTKLLPYVVKTVADFHSVPELFRKRLRWMTVMRHMRPLGHFGLIFTWGLPWSCLAVAMHPTAVIAVVYLGTYVVLRIAMVWAIGVWGMRQIGLWKELPLFPVWDALAFMIWLTSFTQSTIRWRGADYFIRQGKLTLRA
jgi:ceramide glucosyltransferase